MEKLFSNYILKSLSSYFNYLAKLGYKNYTEVNELIVLLFIDELLNNNYVDLINEEDYSSICKAITCILGTSCLLPYPEYIKKTGVGTETISLFRLHENNNNKVTEDSYLRIT